MQKHAQTSKRTVHVVNLDPAAEYFDYQPTVDVRDLIHLDDAMEDEELRFGPNGGLVFCIEWVFFILFSVLHLLSGKMFL